VLLLLTHALSEDVTHGSGSDNILTIAPLNILTDVACTSSERNIVDCSMFIEAVLICCNFMVYKIMFSSSQTIWQHVIKTENYHKTRRVSIHTDQSWLCDKPSPSLIDVHCSVLRPSMAPSLLLLLLMLL